MGPMGPWAHMPIYAYICAYICLNAYICLYIPICLYIKDVQGTERNGFISLFKERNGFYGTERSILWNGTDWNGTDLFVERNGTDFVERFIFWERNGTEWNQVPPAV